jgi:sugar phosphate isomerase/epimerase
MSNTGIALQLYTLRDQMAENLSAALRLAREAGFRYVEWWSPAPLSPQAARAALDAAGLKAISMHVGLEQLTASPEEIIEACHVLGCPDYALGWVPPEHFASPAAWQAMTDHLCAAARRAAAAELRFSFHNHAGEAAPFPGGAASPLDLLRKAADHAPICAELDTAWLHAAGLCPEEAIRTWSGRCPLIHAKDLAARPAAADAPCFAVLGQGVLDWPAIFDAAEEAAVEWIIYEQDTIAGDPAAALAESRRFLEEYA